MKATHSEPRVTLVEPDERTVPMSERGGLPSFMTEGATKISRAHIATHLKPLLEPLLPRISSGTEASIVGFDGIKVIAPEPYPWHPTLDSMLKAGATVRYLLVDRNASLAVEHLRKLARIHTAGKLQVYLPRPQSELNLEAIALFDDLVTRHFMVLNSPRIVWYEGHHAPGSEVATDCCFFDEAAASESALWDTLKAEFDYALSNCVRVV